MAKNKKKITAEDVGTEIEVEEEEPVEPEPDPKAGKKVVEKAKEKIKAAGGGKGVEQNIIGDVEPPEDPEDPAEVRDYLKRIDEKLDRLMPKDEEPEPEPAPEPPKKGVLYWE